MAIKLNNVDLRLLQVFRTIVEAGGFSPAQLLLNVSQPTLSIQMGQLESRLGVRLCQRGRAGFRLTEEGHQVYQASLRLLGALKEFGAGLEAMQGRLVGELQLGIVDSVATNPDFRLSQAIAQFKRRGGDVRLTVHVAPPQEIERAVLDGRNQIGIGTFPARIAGIDYRFLFNEQHQLYAGRDHPFFSRRRPMRDAAAVKRQEHVVRGYATARPATPEVGVNATATAYNMEAMVLLILSGHFLGYLPTHFARGWMERDLLRPVPGPQFTFASRFEIITRKNSPHSAACRAFLKDIDAAFLDPSAGGTARDQRRTGGSEGN
jgi:DNA-binding transcriptional LysR family regulator